MEEPTCGHLNTWATDSGVLNLYEPCLWVCRRHKMLQIIYKSYGYFARDYNHIVSQHVSCWLTGTCMVHGSRNPEYGIQKRSKICYVILKFFNCLQNFVCKKFSFSQHRDIINFNCYNLVPHQGDFKLFQPIALKSVNLLATNTFQLIQSCKQLSFERILSLNQHMKLFWLFCAVPKEVENMDFFSPDAPILSHRGCRDYKPSSCWLHLRLYMVRSGSNRRVIVGFLLL